MRIKIGDRYRDYINTLYVVKSYKDKIITFEVDNGNEKDEVLHKSLFESEINGNRFFRDIQPKTEISDKDIKKGIKREWNYLNYQDRHWMEEGAKWYREQLKSRQ